MDSWFDNSSGRVLIRRSVIVSFAGEGLSVLLA
jgi:hypothetical protein